VRRTLGLAFVAALLAGCGAFPWTLPEAIDGRPAITDEQALSIAREAAPDAAKDGEVLDFHRASFGDVADPRVPVLEGPQPAPGDCVIVINLGHDEGSGFGEGAHVILDCDSGAVLHIWEWAS
jgi:hypothetical protein